MKANKTQFVKDLREKDKVSAPFLVKQAQVAMGKNGKSYMNVTLADNSGEVEAKIWDNVPSFSHQVVRDALVHIEGQVQSYLGRLQVVIREADLLREDEVDLELLLPKGTVDPEKLWVELTGLVQSMTDPHYRALCEEVLLKNPEVQEKLKRAPAAKSIHHAYPGGLLEHIVSVTKLLDLMSQHYEPHLNRDLLFIGGFFHDLCKIWELEYDRATDYTMEGRLIGHLVMGSELIEKTVQKLNATVGALKTPFTDEKRLLAKHMVVAHHGKLEYGSPKDPQVLEALVVHMIDDLDSKMNHIRLFIEQDLQAGSWTLINRQYSRYFYKPEAARKNDRPALAE